MFYAKLLIFIMVAMTGVHLIYTAFQFRLQMSSLKNENVRLFQLLNFRYTNKLSMEEQYRLMNVKYSFHLMLISFLAFCVLNSLIVFIFKI